MRRFSAHYIVPVNEPPIRNGIVEIDEDGTILNVFNRGNHFKEEANLEFYNGIITPGFINAHCHIELSYLKGKIVPDISLEGFIGQMIDIRRIGKEADPGRDIFEADKEMEKEGIVAVGDISNGADSIERKLKSNLYYHTFVEVTGTGVNAVAGLDSFLNVYNQFVDNGLKASLSPHAPYSVTKELYLELMQCNTSNSIISIHHQESEQENSIFLGEENDLLNMFMDKGIDFSGIRKTGKSSTGTILNWIQEKQKVLFIHNVYITRDEIKEIGKKLKNSFFVFCPGSNMYIQKRLPDFDYFAACEDVIAIGTDSYASNTRLSILEEIKLIQSSYPSWGLNELIRFATINGAKALGIENLYGTIQPGKKPGLNLIDHIDFSNWKLSKKSKVKKLI